MVNYCHVPQLFTVQPNQKSSAPKVIIAYDTAVSCCCLQFLQDLSISICLLNNIQGRKNSESVVDYNLLAVFGVVHSSEVEDISAVSPFPPEIDCA